MFFVDTPPVGDYSDPWADDFWTRYAAFRRGSHRVAYFYEKADNSTFRYRAYNMVQTLNDAAGEISAGYFFPADGNKIDMVLNQADTIVLCRMRYEAVVARIVAIAKSRGITVLYDVDDLVFDTDFTHMILGTLAQDFAHPGVWDHWFAYISRIGTALRMCDAAITTNPYLAQRISDFSGKPAFIVPNFMNHQQLEFSQRLYEEKFNRGFQRNDLLHVGYFSGTPTHKRDFDLAVPALADLLARQSQVRVLIVGYMSIPGELERFGNRVEVYPFHDFVNLQRIISLVELNIVPLVDNVFTNCKSELKYFEAAAVGTLTIASPTSTYAAAIQHGVNGWLSSSIEWGAALDEAIASIERGDGMWQTAHDQAVGTYSGRVFKNAIVDATTWRGGARAAPKSQSEVGMPPPNRVADAHPIPDRAMRKEKNASKMSADDPPRLSIDQLSYFAGHVVIRGQVDCAQALRSIVFEVKGRIVCTQPIDAKDTENGVTHFGFTIETGMDAFEFSDPTLVVEFADGTHVRFEAPGTAEILADRGHRLFPEFAERIRAIPQGRMLEIGSRARSGVIRRGLAPPAWGYVGMDIVPGPNVDVVGDAHELSRLLPPSSFDAAMSLSVFEHLMMPWKVVIELNRVLKTGALVFIQTHQTFPLHDEPWDFWRISSDAWPALFNARTGFRIIDSGMAEPLMFVAKRWHPGVNLHESRGCAVSSVIAEKTGETGLAWDVDLRDVLGGQYPG